MRPHPVLLGLLIAAAAASVAPAQESAPVPAAPPQGGEPEHPLEVHGYLLGAVSRRTTGAHPPGGEGGDYVLAEERLRLELGGASPSGERLFLVKGDLFHDAVAGTLEVDLREAYAGYTRGPLDLRLGRQIVTWGVGDLFFINDVFPKDWESFFSGRPMEYLKLGVDGVRVRHAAAAVNTELLAVPFFTPDTLPPPDRFSLFDPFAAVPVRREREPETRFSNTELALRLYRRVAGFDASLYAYRGFWRTPGVRLDSAVPPTTATRFFPRLAVYGLSAQRGLLSGVLSLEAGRYDSRQDRRGEDPAVINSQWRFLAGYQRELWTDFTAGVQLYAELLSDYRAYNGSLPPGAPRQDRLREVASIRLTRWLRYQTWKLGLFAAYSPTDRDSFLEPEISLRATDAFSVSLGANIFGGQETTTFFGQFDSSDNVFLNARLEL